MTTPLKFYTDSHIQKAVADQLRAQGVDVVRCQDVGMADADDLPHLEYATEEGRVVVTNDKAVISALKREGLRWIRLKSGTHLILSEM